jgi:hypothetical protein
MNPIDASEEFLELIEHNIKHGTKYQRGAARELLLRFLEGKLSAPIEEAGVRL